MEVLMDELSLSVLINNSCTLGGIVKYQMKIPLCTFKDYSTSYVIQPLCVHPVGQISRYVIIILTTKNI